MDGAPPFACISHMGRPLGTGVLRQVYGVVEYEPCKYIGLTCRKLKTVCMERHAPAVGTKM